MLNMKKKILVTGGLGYIGSHTVVALQEEGYEVIIIDDLSNAKIFFLDNITSITGIHPIFKKIDLKNKNKIKDFFDNYSIDGIIHFASLKSVEKSIQIPLKYYYNNIISLIHILDIFKERGLDNFIFSSSCTVYGEVNKLPIKENTSINLSKSPYGKTKQISEEILKDYVSAYNKKVISLRYFNPIGAHPSYKIGELLFNESQNLISSIIKTSIGEQKELLIFGGDYPTLDGTTIRDYIYVCDVAKAHVAALNRIFKLDNNSFEALNLGTGKGYSILEIVKIFQKITNIKIKSKIVKRRKGDIIASYSDTELSYKLLNWKPEISLIKALETAWIWGKKYFISYI